MCRDVCSWLITTTRFRVVDELLKHITAKVILVDLHAEATSEKVALGWYNEQKGDADAATWLPPNRSFRCSYVATQVAVKVRYHLWVTPAEHQAIAGVLSTCPTQPLPTGAGTAASPPTVAPAPRPVPTPAPPTTRPSTPAPSPTTPGTSPGLRVVHAGAFCSPPGARGVTVAGTPMTCKLDSKGQRYRWSHT